MKLAIVLSLILIQGCASINQTRSPAESGDSIHKPAPFPATTNAVQASDQNLFASASKRYCSTFSTGMLSKTEDAKPIRAIYERVCSFRDGKDQWVGLSDASDDQNNRFVMDVITLQAVAKASRSLNNGSSSPDIELINKFLGTLTSQLALVHLFDATEYDTNGVPTQGRGVLVTLYGSQLSAREIAGKLGDYKRWAQQQIDSIQ